MLFETRDLSKIKAYLQEEWLKILTSRFVMAKGGKGFSKFLVCGFNVLLGVLC